MKYLPYTFPSNILEFMHDYMNGQLKDCTPGESKPLRSPSISEYHASIPQKERAKHINEYHNALLRIFQLMTNEGLITPKHNNIGFYQEYSHNGFNPKLAKYGRYDFPILGFKYMRHVFQDAVKPVILNQGDGERPESIGSGFIVNANSSFDNNLYFVTARHCISPNNRVFVPAFIPANKPCRPEKIYVPEKKDIDLAVIRFSFENPLIGREHNFWLGTPSILDKVLTMGYPPIPGFVNAIQVAEVSQISSFLKSTEGRITGTGQHYWGGNEDHFLISARVKGGNSGGPVINEKGEVVGIVIELLGNGSEIDRLGYGVALSGQILIKMIDKIEGKSDQIEIKELEFDLFENGFEVK